MLGFHSFIKRRRRRPRIEPQREVIAQMDVVTAQSRIGLAQSDSVCVRKGHTDTVCTFYFILFAAPGVLRT